MLQKMNNSNEIKFFNYAHLLVKHLKIISTSKMILMSYKAYRKCITKTNVYKLKILFHVVKIVIVIEKIMIGNKLAL